MQPDRPLSIEAQAHRLAILQSARICKLRDDALAVADQHQLVGLLLQSHRNGYREINQE